MVDVHFRGGTVWTGDPSRPRAEAVTVRAGRVLALDDAGGGVTVDLAGGCLVPGFRDGHIHPLTGGVALGGVLLVGATTLGELLANVAAHARAHPELPVVHGKGYDPSLAPRGIFDAADLDAVVPDRPVVLIASDGHTAWANSAALAKAGIDASTPDPPRGAILRRPDGSPIGTLLESAQDLVEALVPPLSLDDRVAALRLALAHMAAAGIVWGQEAACEPDDAQVFLAAAERGHLTSRFNLALLAQPDQWREQREVFLALRDEVAERGAGLVTARSIKFFADGIIESGTGALLAPYEDIPHSCGIPNWEPAELTEAVATLDADGFQPHIHAIGDAAVRAALDAVEGAAARNGDRDRRATIAHTQLVHPDDYARFAALGVIANFEPLWAHQDPIMTDLTEPRLGPDRSALQYPMASLVRNGARISFGSDWPVSSMVPIEGIATAVTRQNAQGEPPGGWTPGERLPVAVALSAYTAGTAYQAFDPPGTGTVTPGARADLVLLDADPTAVDPSAIADIAVLGTWLAGQEVHRS